MPGNTIRVSAVIPTLGRHKEVVTTVRALLAQTRVPDEIVVVDQNQPPLPELDEDLQKLPSVKHIRNSVPGWASNYNRCLKEAKEDIVIYFDDDVELDSRLVEAHISIYSEKSSSTTPLGGVAGRVEQPHGDLPPDQITEVGKYHRWSGKVVGHFNSNRRADVDIAPGGNMSFFKDLMLQAGGFDYGFGGNGYFAETDMVLRVKRLGYKIVFTPEATLKHLMAPVGGSRTTDKATHTYYFIKNGIRLYRRHSPKVGLPFFVLKSIGYVFAKSVYNLDTKLFTRGLQAVVDGLSQSIAVLQK